MPKRAPNRYSHTRQLTPEWRRSDVHLGNWRSRRRPVEIVFKGIVALQKLRRYNGIMNTRSLERLTDEQLLADLNAAAAEERDATAHLIALLAEMDSRRLYLAQGYSSLFVYCTKCLKLSEHAAYGRIEAARAGRRFPLILRFLTDGSITLTTVCLVAAHLTESKHREVLERAMHKTKREVEQQVAVLSPLLPAPSIVRKLPPPRTSSITLTNVREEREVSPLPPPTATEATPVMIQPRQAIWARDGGQRAFVGTGGLPDSSVDRRPAARLR